MNVVFVALIWSRANFGQARSTGQILKSAKLVDLPIWWPTKFEFNLGNPDEYHAIETTGSAA